MQFHEILIRERKARGLSQEDLARRIGVTRQAVSKWETGDSAPDLNNLQALADTLELSLDVLCGRELSAPADEPSITPVPFSGNLKGFPFLGLLVAALVVIMVICFGNAHTKEETPPESPLMMLTEPFTVTGVSFHGLSDRDVQFRFTPSISGDRFTYTISFVGADGIVKTFDAPCSEGICSGVAGFGEQYGGYSVSVSVSDGTTSRNLAIADDVSWSKFDSSWVPMVN